MKKPIVSLIAALLVATSSHALDLQLPPHQSHEVLRDYCPPPPAWWKGRVRVKVAVLPSGLARVDEAPILLDGAGAQESRWAEKMTIGNHPDGCMWERFSHSFVWEFRQKN